MGIALDVVIVNWNAGTQLDECVASVLEHGREVVERIVVVDNGSRDGSADAVDGWPGVEVIRAGENLGFAAACNLGATRGAAPYVLFLNPDTRVFEGSLSVPLTFMERPENARVGICGIQLLDEQGGVSRTCARFPTLGRLIASALGVDKLPGLSGSGMRMADWNHSASRHVDQVMGAFFLMRRSAFDECGGFDQNFFVYFEEVDLALRCRQAGWSTIYLADAQAFHAGGGVSRQVKAHRLFYSLRSRMLYGFKHFPRWQAWLLVAVTWALEPLARTIFCLILRDGVCVRNTWAAYQMLWRAKGSMLRGEWRNLP